MEDFRTFNPGDTFRLQFNHRIGSNNYPESVYCKFESCKYLGNSNHIEELIVDQVIDVKEFLNNEEFRIQERSFKHPGGLDIYYRMHD